MDTSNNKKGIKGILEQIRIEGLLGNLPFILFITLLLMLYIAIGHQADRLVRKINKTHKSVKELKTEFVMHKEKLLRITKESELLKILKEKKFQALKEIPLIIQDSVTENER